MVIKVGINGFGRIGRIIARTCLQNSNLQMAAINDPAISTEYICYLLKFDSTHGKLKSNITYFDNIITIDDLQIKVFHETVPPSIPWQTAGVQYVIESSGMFVSLDKASGHLESTGVKRVVITAPSSDAPMIILGVNEHKLCPGQKVISCASSTLYCLAPIIKILEDNFGVTEGFVTSIHAMTPSLKALDGLCLRGKHWRDHRSIHQNIIPAATGACKALGKIIPEVKDKLSGLAFRVPIVDVSVLDLSLRLNTDTNLQDIIKAVEKASQTNMKNIVNLTNENTVSSDFMGEKYSCIVDVNCSIQLKTNFFKIICWYENEYSYACRVVDSIFFSEKQQCLMGCSPMVRCTVPITVTKRDEMLQTISVRVASLSCDCDTGVSKRVGSCDIYFPENSISPDTSPGQLVLQDGSIPCANNNKDLSSGMSLLLENNITSTPIDNKNVRSYFQSCIAFSPPEKKYLNVKERLEKVRREYSKMIKITEDYVKKSNSTQSNKKFSAKDNSTKTILGTNLDTIKNSLEIKPVGDQSVNYKDFYEASKHSVEISGSSNLFALQTTNVHTSDDNQHIVSELDDHKKQKDFNISFDTTEVKDEIINSKYILVDDLKQTTVKGVLNKFKEQDDKFESSIPDANSSQNKRILKSNYKLDVSKQYESPAAKKIHIIDQELKKRNIVLVDSSITRTSNFEMNEKKYISEPKGNTKVLSEDILNGLNQLSLDTIIYSEGTLGCVKDRTEKQDVYDKLDSESETDSNNSFDIHGKKSQIINVTDLTSSLEDLRRLDKICRIIEISDELSDKLFSNLDNDLTTDENKRWSFKDFCEKIKLDEFCNEVFGC